MKKTRSKLLAVAMSVTLVMNTLPMSAFAESGPPATGTDVAIENAPGDEGLTTEEAASPSAPGELPGPQGITTQSGEGKDQDDTTGGEGKDQDDTTGGEGKDQDDTTGGEDKDQDDTTGGEDKGRDDTTGGEGATVGNDPAPTPSGNEQGTPPAAPQGDATSTAPQEGATSAAPHVHEFGTEWHSDDANHWHECTAGDGEKADEAAHAFGDWATVKEATETEPGSRERTCTVCGYAETVAIPATGATRQRTLLGAQGSVDIDEANFPDANFRQYVQDDFDRDRNNALSEAEVAAVTQIDCIQRDIQSLEGVEHFTALEELHCWNNRLSSLDVSKNSALKVLYCDENRDLSSLSLNPGIETLRCVNAGLSSLDVSGCPELETLMCSRNHISSLDVSKNNALKVLEVNNNSLSSLDVSNNALLQDLRCENNNLSSLDIGNNPGLAKLHCHGNPLVALDVSAAAALNGAVETGTRTPGTDYDQYSAAGAELRVGKNVTLTSVPVTHTVTFNIVNGTWDDGTTQKTVEVAEGSAIQASDLPTPQPDEGYGTGTWDTDPVGKTVNGDVAYTWSYFHYTITYDTGGKGTVAPEQSKYWENPENGVGVERFGYPAYCKEAKSGDDKYAIDTCDLNNPNPWFLDPDDLSTVVDFGTELTSDVTVYCKWLQATKVIDAVSAEVTAKAGDPIPKGRWYASGEGQLSDYFISTTGTDYGIYRVKWDRGGDEYFVAGKTYLVSFTVESVDESYFFKGHATAVEDPETYMVANPEVCYALTINGVDQGCIEYVNPNTSRISYCYTVPERTYTVTVNADPAEAGTVTGGGAVSKGDTTSVTATANEGYVFSGWYEGDTKVSDEASYAFAVTKDVALVARFERVTHEVTFRDGEDVLSTTTVNSGDKVTKPATDPKKEGHSFDGWCADPDLKTPFDFDAEIKADTDVYARFAKPYGVSASADPAEGGTVTGGGTYVKGESATVKATASEGYAFDGWYDGETVVSDEASYTFAVTGDTALVARFERVTHTVTFRDGGDVLSTATVKSGDKVSKPATDPAKDGYSFEGWCADPAFKAPFDFDAEIKADTDVYAKWTKDEVVPPPAPATHTISYDLNGGTLGGKTGTLTVEAEEGSTITLPAPTRDGYSFDYWEGSRYNAGDSYVVRGNHTFTARWKENAAPIDDADDGNGGSSDADDDGKEGGDNGGSDADDSDGDNGDKDGAGNNDKDGAGNNGGSSNADDGGKEGGSKDGNKDGTGRNADGDAGTNPGDKASGTGPAASTDAARTSGSTTNGTAAKSSATGTTSRTSSTAGTSTKSASPNTGDQALPSPGPLVLAAAGLLVAGISRRRRRGR